MTPPTPVSKRTHVTDGLPVHDNASLIDVIEPKQQPHDCRLSVGTQTHTTAWDQWQRSRGYGVKTTMSAHRWNMT